MAVVHIRHALKYSVSQFGELGVLFLILKRRSPHIFLNLISKNFTGRSSLFASCSLVFEDV